MNNNLNRIFEGGGLNVDKVNRMYQNTQPDMTLKQKIEKFKSWTMYSKRDYTKKHPQATKFFGLLGQLYCKLISGEVAVCLIMIGW